MKTLIVDDSATARAVLEKMLEPYGACDNAYDGRQGLEAFRHALESNEPYDLVCLDILMPEMNGQEVLKEIRALEVSRGIWGGRGAKVIMTTMVDDSEHVIEALIEDIEAYLVKPIRKKELLNTLQSLGLITPKL